MKKQTWLTLVLSIGTTLAFGQKTESVIALDYFTYGYAGVKNLPGTVQMLTFNGSPSPIENPKDFDNIQYIFYSGNDWDYETKALPPSWFELKNLKGIILSNMDYETDAMNDARMYKPDLFLSDASYCHMHWNTLNSDSANLTYYQVDFQTQTRIPMNEELEKLAWAERLSFDDSLFMLKYLMLNEFGTDDYRYSLIKDSVAKWLPVHALLTQPTMRLLDSLLSQTDLPDSAQNYAFGLLEKMANKQLFKDVTDKYINNYIAQLAYYLPYIDDTHRQSIKSKLQIFVDYKKQGKLSPKTAALIDEILKY